MSEQDMLQAMNAKLDEIHSLAAIAAKPILDLSEAALFTGFSEGHLYRLTSSKQIPHYKKNRKLYFRKAELEDWLTQEAVPTEADINSRAATYLATR